MVRYVLFMAFMLTYIWADVFDDKVRNLIGEQNYQLNVNFLNKIFANKTMYYTNGRLDIAKIVYALKNNGLLTSRFGQPSEVKLSFSARTSPILLTKVTNILDELSKRGFVCLDINRISEQQWEYVLEVNEPRLPNTKFLAKSATLNLREVSGEYWLALNANGDLHIQTINFIKWNPRVVLYDKNLGIVDIVANTGMSASAKIRVPRGVKFVMITDYDSPESLKGGISVNLK